MKRFTILSAALIAAVCGLPAANAGTILSDGFEYADQAAYQAQWGVAPGGVSGNATTALLSTAQASEGTKSVSVPATGSNNEYRNLRTFTPTGLPSATNIISFSLDYWDNPTTASGNPQRNFVNLQAGAAAVSGSIVSLGLNNNLLNTAGGGNYYMARIYGMDGGAGTNAFFKLNDPGAPLRSAGWNNLSVDITDTQFKFYVNGTLAKTIANTATLRSYDRVLLGSGLSNGSVPVYFDNLRVATEIPEPASLSLIGLGMIGATMFRRRRVM